MNTIHTSKALCAFPFLRFAGRSSELYSEDSSSVSDRSDDKADLVDFDGYLNAFDLRLRKLVAVVDNILDIF